MPSLATSIPSRSNSTTWNDSALAARSVRTFLSPVEGGGSGLGPDALSAYSDYAFEMLHPLKEDEGGSDQMFPGGNATIARLMLKSLIPAAINGPATVEGVSRGAVNFAALDAAQTAIKGAFIVHRRMQ